MESSHAADHTERKKLKSLAEIAADIFRDLSPTPEVAENRSIATDGTSGLYTPLQEGQIRLLSIIPSEEFDAPLICTLRPVTLSKARYAAISYVWGDPSNPEGASINGHIVLLQRNLASALRHIRATGASEVCGALWADAICINQHDIPEKNQQVGMMDRVYPCATLVIAWLGSAQLNITAAFKSIVHVSAVLPNLRTSAEKVSLLASEFKWSKRHEPGFGPSSLSVPGSWKGLNELHSHEYWTRGWIVQEVVLSKELIFMCGQELITARQLRKVHETLASIEKTELDFWSQLTEQWPNFRWLLLDSIHSLKALAIRGSSTGHQSINILSGLLFLTAEHRVSNPRDKVYALLGMTGLQDTISPDYSTPVRSLYISTCDLLLKNKTDLSFLVMGRMSTLDHHFAVDAQMPSWLPNLHAISRRTDDVPNLSQFFGDAYHAATSLNGEAEILASPYGSYLAVDGYIIDTVEAVHTVTGYHVVRPIIDRLLFIHDSPKESTFPVLQAACRTVTGDIMRSSRIRTFDDKAYVGLGVGFLLMLHAWYEHCLEERTESPEYQQSFVSFFNCLCPDPSNSENLAEVVREHFLGGASEFRHWTSERICRDFYRPPDKSAQAFQSHQILDTAMSRMQARSTIRSSEGHCGHAPLDTKVGDQICILKGCGFPVVLRKQPQYVYVGPCFVLGFMDGEVVDMAQRGEVQEERFEIF